MNAVKFHWTLPTDEELQGINIWGERKSKLSPRMISLLVLQYQLEALKQMHTGNTKPTL